MQAYFKIICGHKCCQIIYYHALSFIFKGENKHEDVEFYNTYGFKWF